MPTMSSFWIPCSAINRGLKHMLNVKIYLNANLCLQKKLHDIISEKNGMNLLPKIKTLRQISCLIFSHPYENDDKI